MYIWKKRPDKLNREHQIRKRKHLKNKRTHTTLFKRISFVLFLLALSPAITYGQWDQEKEAKKKMKSQKRNRFPSYFGLQVKPIIPIRMFGTGPETLSKDNFSATVTPLWGYSFGGTIRVGITKRFAIETGLNIVRRNYRTDYAVPDSNLSSQTTLGVVSYDIPLNLLIYVQMSEKWFMNASYGVSGNFYPSNVRTDDNGYPNMFSTEGLRMSWIRAAMNTNVGVELRTEKAGTFYLGASFQYPFGAIFKIATTYKYKNINKPIYGEMNGTYVTFDIKYFLPFIKRKGPQFIPGPIG